MSRRDELEALATEWNTAWNGRDAGALASFFHDDATFYEPGLGPSPVPAKQGIISSAEATWRDWPESEFTTVSLTVDGDRVVVEWRAEAKHRTGRPYTLQGVDILEWDGPRIRSARVYFDVHDRLVAIGD